MLDPYRVPGPVEPDLPTSCTNPQQAIRCAGFVPEPPRFPASIGFPALPPPHPRVFTIPRAVTAAATALLLVASASLSAVTFAVVTHRIDAKRHRAHERELVQSMIPQTALPMLPGTPVWVTDSTSHMIDDLWRSAENLAAANADVTLARARLPRALAEAGLTGGAMRVRYEMHKGYSGLRVLAVGERSAAALAGVRAGDLITAVNDIPMSSPELGRRAFETARDAHALVAEMRRDGHRVMLRVDWDE
ncbi:Hypothetical protein A7982_02878 [Minicystis rosea]|nr:Hypothetical protein A7982_02878 [Minicystis rosea]